MRSPSIVLIDPFLLSLPGPHPSVEVLDLFCDGLLSWSGALDRDDVVLCLSTDAVAAMFDDHVYPYEFTLRDMLKELAIDHFDHETVCMVARRLLEKAKHLEDLMHIHDVTFVEERTRIDPAFV